MATITTLLNNISGLTFRQTVNDNFSALNTAKSETTHNHDGTYTPVATTTDIDTRLTTLESATLDTRVTSLEDFHTYDTNSVANVTVTNDVYENIMTLVTPTRVAGTYEIRMSQLYSLNSTTNSAFFRFRVNGGTWVEVRREPKDNTDLVPMNYWKAYTHVSGTITVEIEARKGNAADILTIAEMSIAIDRKV